MDGSVVFVVLFLRVREGRKEEERGGLDLSFMSLNQSRTEKSEAQVRRPVRPGNSSQQRNFAGGGGKGGGGGVAAPPLSSPGSSSSVPSLSTNRR